MSSPLGTGQVARLLGTTEPKLAEAVRRGRVTPPPVQAGRRLWHRDHIFQAAVALSLPLEDIATVEAFLDERAPVASHA